MVLFTALLIALVSPTLGQFPCPSSVQLNGNLGMDTTPVPPNTTCSFTITIPSPASFAEVEVIGNSMDKDDEITVVGTFDNIRSFGEPTFNLHAAFPYGIVQITIMSSATSTMTFSYSMVRQMIPPANKIQIVDKTGGMAQFIQTQTMNVGDLYEVTADTKVALAAAAPTTTSQFDFLNIFLYEGTGDNKKLLGSLYSAQQLMKLSSTNSVTLQYVFQGNDNFVGTIIANDDGNLQSLCTDYSYFYLDQTFTNFGYASRGNFCVTFVNSPDGSNAPYFLHYSGTDQFQTINVVAGAPGGFPLATYGPGSNFTLPQYLPGFARTLVFSESSGNIQFSYDPVEAKDHVPVSGRQGFFMTNNFQFNSTQQNSAFYLNSTTPFNFTFTIQQSSQAPGSYMNVYGTSGLLQKIPLFNATNNVSYSFSDKLIDLDISGGQTANTGYYITYQVSDAPKPAITCPTGTQSLQGTLSLDLGVIPPDFDCFFTFQIPDATSFFDVTLTALNIADDEFVQVMGTYDTFRQEGQNLTLHAPFAGNQLRLFVRSNNSTNMLFGYKLVKKTMPTLNTAVQLQDQTGFMAQFVQTADMNVGDVYEITATTQVALSTGFPLGTSEYDFLNVFLYEGTGDAKKLLGSLYSAQNRIIVSSGNRVTLVYVSKTDDNFLGTIIANDEGNMAQCQTYSVNWLTPRNLVHHMATYPMNATEGTACMTLLNYGDGTNAPYLYNVNIVESTGTYVLLATAGGPGGFPLAHYSIDGAFTEPQYYPGFARTFILNKGYGDVDFVFNPAFAEDHVPFLGRTGFFMSQNFMFNSTQQNAISYFNNTSPFNYTFTIVQSAKAPGSYLNVYGFNGLRQRIDLTTAVNTSYTFVDTLIDLDIEGGATASTGYYAIFAITDVPKGTLTCPGSPTVLNGNINQPLSIVPPNFNCSFTYTFDPTVFAEVTVTAYNIASGESVQVQGVKDTVTNGASSNFSIHAAFPSNQVTVYVSSGAQTNILLGFTLNRKFVNFNEPYVMSVQPDIQAQFVQIHNNQARNTTWEITANTSVALIASGPPLTPQYDFLNIFVYEGIGDNRTLVGSLYSIYNTLYVSQSNSLTLYYAVTGDSPFIGTFIANDNKNLNGCQSYSTQWSYTTSPVSPRTISLDATQGKACLTILNDYNEAGDSFSFAPYFSSYKITGQGAADVIVGAPQYTPLPEYVLGSMGPYPTFSAPQFFPGFARTITLTKGTLNIGIAFDSNTIDDNMATVGRKGFVASNNYLFVSTNQDAHFSLQGINNAIFNLTFSIKSLDAPTDANVQVYNSTGLAQTIPISGQFGQQMFSVADSLIALTVDGGSQGFANLGTYIQYMVYDATPNNGASTNVPPPTTTTTQPPPQTPVQTTTTTTTVAPTSSSSQGTTTTTAPQTTTPKKSTAAVSALLCIVATLLFF